MLHSMFASHSTHSESSSPDILAPPGDADYLISSPFRPFPGRQSSLMSPANRRILHTPGAAKRKRSRISLSPAKSAHSIRFDDIVLPGSPTRKLDGRQRSASPDKVDADGNVSPWRIRVTLEATQDDQENQGSPSRKRPKQRTTTTKVPLKDSSEQTPRRRGRPRKSGASDTTPAAGSPGNTPGPVNSEQKRRRGRPRKHKPESDAAAENNVIENNEQPGGDVQMMDPALAGTELERRSWSPLNLAGDADSDDGIYDNEPLDIPFEGPAHTEFGEPEPPTEDPNPQPSIEPTYDTPNGDAIDRFNYQQGDDELHSTPSKMPSPTRELPTVSPENSIHAGHTPMPPRTYPTSASTSLVDNEQPERNQYSREPSASSSKPSAVRSSDPTNEHREFDSIIESEGFSMVSLDTLPSAQQHGLRSNPKLAKGALKPFIERETNGVLRRKTTIPEHQSEVASPPSPSPDPALSPERHLDSPQLRGSIRSSAAKRIPFSPIPTKGFSPAPQRKPLLRLAKLVRAGIALERVLSHSNPPYSPGNAVPDYMAPRQRLEVIFSDLNSESQRVLGAALGLGQVLAIRRKMMELRSPQRRALVAEELEDEDDHAGLDFEYTKREVSRTPNRQYDGAADPSPVSSSPDTDMKQRFAEWQRERDAVSRTIQMANSSQVIVIDSDVDTPNSNAGERDVGDLTPLVSQWNRKRHAEVQDDDYDNQEDGHVYDDNQNRRELGQEEKQQQRELEDDEGADVNQSRWMSRWNQDHQEEVQEDGYDNEEEEDIYDPRQSSREPRQEEEEEEAEQGELEEDNHGNQEQRSDYDDDQSLWMPKRNGEQQRAADEEKHDVEKGRADYVASQNSRIPRLDEYQHSEVVEEDYADVDEDDGYEDIWQVQAKYEGNSGRESMLEPQDELQSSPQKGGSTPADRGYSMSFSPTHWVDGQGKMPSLGQSRVRELREQEVDISALLRAEDTPNRARYYYGRSSPLSSAQGHSPQHNMLSSAASHRQKHVERYDDELGQLGEVEEPADYLDFSPEKDLEDETFQIDPTTRHESEMQRYPSDFADNASISDDAGDEPPVHEETLTPKNPAPANRGGQATSWYERITNLTPGWLKAPLQNPSPQNKHSSPPTNRSNSKEPSLEEQSEHSEQEEQDREQDWKQDSEYEKEEEEEEEEEEEGEQQHHVHSPDEDNSRKAQKPQPDPLSESEVDQIWAPSPQPKAKRTSETAKEEPNLTATEKSPEKPRRLATSGYFSNAHYTLLRRLYRLAKQSPESFTYHSSSSHSGIIGDYIWTSDNTYGVPVTELQFAIVYRFRQELAAEDLKSGGTGWVGWTDADLHRRLVSVIIGEQIREDRKNVHDLRPTRSKPRSIIQRG